MKRLRDYLSNHKYFYLLLLFIPLQIWFDYSEMTVTPKYFTQTWLDAYIPFLSIFIVPYLLWFVFIPYGVIYIGMHSRKDFYKLLIFLCGGMAVSNLMYTLFPNAQGLRPAISSSDPFSMLVKMIYSVDTPTDVCPSMHVVNSLAINSALQHSEAFCAKKPRKIAAVLLTVLICLSTVFVKQHAILDVICGLVTAALFYIPIYILPVRGTRKQRSALMREDKAE